MGSTGLFIESNVYLRSTPHPVTVTTRIITFFVGNPYKPSFATVTGWGVDPARVTQLQFPDFFYMTSLQFTQKCRYSEPRSCDSKNKAKKGNACNCQMLTHFEISSRLKIRQHGISAKQNAFVFPRFLKCSQAPHLFLPAFLTSLSNPSWKRPWTLNRAYFCSWFPLENGRLKCPKKDKLSFLNPTRKIRQFAFPKNTSRFSFEHFLAKQTLDKTMKLPFGIDISGQILIFHQPGFPWKLPGNSLNQNATS